MAIQNISDRRRDSALRASMDRMLKIMSHLSDWRLLYSKSLEELNHLSSSAYSFVLEVQSPLQHGYTFELAALQVSPKTESFHRQYDNFLPISVNDEFRFLEPVINSGVSKVFKAESLGHLNHSKLNWPRMQQLLVLPLIDKNKVFGLIGLANSPHWYNTELAKRCWPLVVTTAMARRMVSREAGTEPNQEPWCQVLTELEARSPVPKITMSSDNKVLRMNSAAENLFEVRATSLLGKSIDAIISEKFPNQLQAHTSDRHRFQKKPIINRLIGRKADGMRIPIGVLTIPFQDDGNTFYFLEIIDRSANESVREEQSKQTQRFKAVSDLAPIGILQTNLNWEATYVNRRWCDICGFDETDVLELGWINAVHPDDVADFLSDLRKNIVEGKEYEGECRFQSPRAEMIWVAFRARPLFKENGYIEGFVATLTDVTYRHVTEEKLRVMAERDVLTGLANRALFQDRLNHALARAPRHGAFALLCLDLDRFKHINDTLGHDAGDVLLVEVGNRLLSCVRLEDTVARVGGDEFFILLEGFRDAAIAAEVSEKILEALQKPFNLCGQEVFISTSIGITFAVGRNRVEPNTLIKQADIALYRAKAEGRNNYQYFSPELEESSKRRLVLGNSLHRALERSEFSVYFHLQAHCGTDQYTGTEALLRWQHPERGTLSPTEFIHLLEESGLIIPVSLWVWKEAFQTHCRWMDKGVLPKNSHVAVNLSPRQLRDPNMLEQFTQIMTDTGIKGRNVVIEITETALLEDSKSISETLKSLQKIGVKIALDDFGTGYSSLTYLKRFSIDIIKIDRSFIRDIEKDQEDAAITQGVIALAKSLNISLVAEGVDSIEKLLLLKKWGCARYQGHLLNEPCPEDKLSQLLAKPISPIAMEPALEFC